MLALMNEAAYLYQDLAAQDRSASAAGASSKTGVFTNNGSSHDTSNSNNIRASTSNGSESLVTCPEYDLLQEKLDTSVFPLMLILLHDEDSSVATSTLRSLALAAAAPAPPPPASADGTKKTSNNAAGDNSTDEAYVTVPANAFSSSSSSVSLSSSDGSSGSGGGNTAANEEGAENDDEDAVAGEGTNEEGDGTVGAAAATEDSASEGDDDASNRRSRRRLSSSSLQPPRQTQRLRLPLLSVRHVGKLMPTVQDLRSHRDWRLREWAVAVVPLLHAASATAAASAAEEAPLSPSSSSSSSSPPPSSSSSLLSPLSPSSASLEGCDKEADTTIAVAAALENASINDESDNNSHGSIRSSISMSSADARAQATAFRAQLLEVIYIKADCCEAPPMLQHRFSFFLTLSCTFF